MTLPPGRPSGPPRAVTAPLVAGVALAIVADATALSGGYIGLRSLLPATASPPIPHITVTPGPAVPPAVTVPAAPTPGRTSSAGTPQTAPTASKTAKRTTGPVQVTAALKRGIVLIESSNGSTASAGTGMILTSDGQVLTNYHVVRSSVEISVTVAGTKDHYAATLVGRDSTKDVALLQLADASDLATIVTDPDPIGIGDPVIAAGNTGGQGYLSAYAGTIVGEGQNVRVRGSQPEDPDENLTGLLETDARAQPGDSGGPLFDAENEVTGMTTAGSGASRTAPDSTAFAVPIADAMAVVGKIRAGDESGSVVIGPRASLGVTVAEDGTAGLKVRSVDTGSPAATAGIRAGDHLNTLAGRPVVTMSEYAAALDGVQPGQQVKVEWRAAGGGTRSATVTLAKSKTN